MTTPTRPTQEPARPARRVSPRPLAAATAAVLGLAVPLVPAMVLAPAAFASETGEGGEAGEAGVVRQSGTAGFLADLGLFEAAHRIVGTLYQRGEYAEALEQLQDSHHAFYDDIEPALTALGAPGFAAEAEAFAQAIADEVTTEIAAARLSALLAAIDAARDASQATLGDRLLSMKSLLDVAAADYAGGVENGVVTLDHEYRDAWGFVETVRARAQHLAQSADPATAQAGTEVLDQLAPLAPLFPDLTATQTSGDPDLIAVAAAWVEIIALRHR